MPNFASLNHLDGLIHLHIRPPENQPLKKILNLKPTI